jgi:hypothetical protein
MKEEIDSRAKRRGVSRHELVQKWLGDKLKAEETRRGQTKRRKVT